MKGSWLAFLVAALSACSTGQERQAVTAAPAQRIAPRDLPDFFDCLRTSDGALVAAHRGGPGPGFAENSLATFEHTVSRAPAMLEVDVQMLADGALALMHDDTVDRTTNGTGRTSAYSLRQLQALRLKDETGRVLDAHPPSLKEALDWAKERTILELDVKRGTPLERVVEAVRDADARNRVVIIVTSAEDAITVHRLDPTLMISVPIDSGRDLTRLREADVDLSRVLAWTGTNEPNSALNVALAQRGVEAMFGTLGSSDSSWDARFIRSGEEGYAAFAETGVAVIATDRPEAAYRALDQSDGDGWGPGRCLR